MQRKVITCGSVRTGQDDSVPPDIIRKLGNRLRIYQTADVNVYPLEKSMDEIRGRLAKDRPPLLLLSPKFDVTISMLLLTRIPSASSHSVSFSKEKDDLCFSLEKFRDQRIRESITEDTGEYT